MNNTLAVAEFSLESGHEALLKNARKPIVKPGTGHWEGWLPASVCPNLKDGKGRF